MLKKILQTQFHLLSINVGWTLASLLMLPFYVSYLSPSDYGVLAILMVVVALGNFLSTANLQMGYTAFYFDIEQDQRLSYLYQNLKLALSISGIYLLAGGLMVYFYNLFLDESIPSSLLLIALIIAAQKSVQGIYNVYLQHEKMTTPYSLTNGTIIAINVVLQLAFLVVFGLGVASVVYALLISYFIGNLMCFTAVRKCDRSKTFSLNPMLKYALSLFPLLLAEWFIIRGDRIIVDRFFDLEQVGIYALTLNVAFLLSTIGTTYLNAARPEFFSYLKSVKKFRSVIFSTFFRALVVMLVVGSVCIYLLSLSLKLFTTHGKYQAIEDYILFALVIVAIRICIRFFSEVFVYIKNHKAQNYLSITNAVLFSIALLFLHPFGSILSVMYALLISNLMTLVFVIIVISMTQNKILENV